MKLNKAAAIVLAGTFIGVTSYSATVPTQVQAKASYKVQITKNAYVYTSKGKKTKTVYKKNKVLTAYKVRKIKGKYYYDLGKGKYVRTSHAKKYYYLTTTQTKKITRTIKMYQPKGVKTVKQNAYVKRTVKTSLKTHKKTYGKWSTSFWKKYKVATPAGYKASKKTVKKQKVTSKTKNKTVKITYKLVKKTTKPASKAVKKPTASSKPATKPSQPASKSSTAPSRPTNTQTNTGSIGQATTSKPAQPQKPAEPAKAPEDKVTEKAVPYKMVYKADPSMEAGSKKVVVAGQSGTDTITTTYNVDGSVKSTSTARTKTPIDEVVAVGTKSVAKTEVVPYKTVQKNDDTLAKGTTKVTVKGVNGSKTTTTTYTLNAETGEVAAHTDVKTTGPVDEVVAVGTKEAQPAEPAKAPEDKVTEKTVDFKTVYQADPTMAAGSKKVVVAGQSGVDRITTTYNVDGSVKSTSTVRTKEAVNEIIAVGTKSVVKTEAVPYKTVQKNDNKMDKGTTKVTVKGINGSKTTTTTYTLNAETGEVTAHTDVKTTAPVDEVVAVGTREANPYTPEKINLLRRKLLESINEYRAEVGADPVTLNHTYNSILDARAASKAKDLGTTGSWDHSGFHDLPTALTTVTDEDLKAHNANDGWAHGGESIGANRFNLYDTTEDQINGYMYYEKMSEDDEKADYQAIVIDKTRTTFNGPSQTYRHYTMMVDKKITKVYIGVGTYVDNEGHGWISAVFEFKL